MVVVALVGSLSDQHSGACDHMRTPYLWNLAMVTELVLLSCTHTRGMLSPGAEAIRQNHVVHECRGYGLLWCAVTAAYRLGHLPCAHSSPWPGPGCCLPWLSSMLWCWSAASTAPWAGTPNMTSAMGTGCVQDRRCPCSSTLRYGFFDIRHWHCHLWPLIHMPLCTLFCCHLSKL